MSPTPSLKPTKLGQVRTSLSTVDTANAALARW